MSSKVQRAQTAANEPTGSIGGLSDREWIEERLAEHPNGIPSADELARPFLVGLLALHDTMREMGEALEGVFDQDDDMRDLADQWLLAVSDATDMVSLMARSCTAGDEKVAGAMRYVFEAITGSVDRGLVFAGDRIHGLAREGLS